MTKKEIAIEIAKERIEELKADIIEFRTLQVEAKTEKDEFKYKMKATECECLLETHTETLKGMLKEPSIVDILNDIMETILKK